MSHALRALFSSGLQQPHCTFQNDLGQSYRFLSLVIKPMKPLRPVSFAPCFLLAFSSLIVQLRTIWANPIDSFL
ncbi:hypothetical protein PGT21_010935 [Puccinia graminis f. sp. tritici]|uniref:Uncharacterized protein n=1 Tax=Puccinia graminis f. sp. tritici TaxID=56615 RepID=A0A5B0NAP9_PUCGR|nr:hypothetical protein PGT21_010935 [Puccinia graminis f. sp. tritici]